MLLFFVFRIAGFWVLNLSSLSKILVCGAGDIIVYFRFMFMSICFVRFVFLLFFGGVILLLIRYLQGAKGSLEMTYELRNM